MAHQLGNAVEGCMARVDMDQLESAIAQCFNLSMDAQVSEKAQNRYMGKAMLLRERSAVLKAKDFGEGDQAVKSANLQLVDINDRLADVKAGLGNIPESLAVLERLTGTLDTLVTLVELTLEPGLSGIYGDARADSRS